MDIFRHDLEPPLQVDLTRQDPETEEWVPVDLSDASSVRVIFTGVLAKAATVSLTDEQKAAGLVEYAWVQGDTEAVGSIKVEVEVMWPGNRPQTFQPKDVVKVKADRG